MTSCATQIMESAGIELTLVLGALWLGYQITKAVARKAAAKA